MIEPLVSVIIPTYNRLHYVQQAVESVLGQTYPNVEVWVIDDGSNDGTGAALQERFGEHIHYMWQENQGRSSARNQGLALANGTYIAFLDSDDSWLPEKLSIQVREIQKSGNKNIVAVFSSAWRIGPNGKRIGSLPVGVAKDILNFSLADFFGGPKIFAAPSNLLVRADVLRRAGGFDPSISYGEDWDLTIRLRVCGTFSYIDKPLFNYRVHPSGTQGILMEEKIPHYLDDKLKIIRKNAVFLPDNGQALKTLEGELYVDFAYRYFAVGCIPEGWRYIQHALELGVVSLNSIVISQQVGYWVAIGALERYQHPDAAEIFFLDLFLTDFQKQWPLDFGLPPAQNELSAWFYHNLAFLIDPANLNMKAHFFLKSIKNKPSLILSLGGLVAKLVLIRFKRLSEKNV